MDRLREWEVAERAAVAAERLASNLDGVDPTLGAVRHARAKAQSLRRRADELMAAVVQQLGERTALAGVSDPGTEGEATS